MENASARWALALSFAVAALSPAVTAAQEASRDARVARLVAEGEAALEAGAARRASRRFRAALRHAPSDPDALFGYCRATLPEVASAPARPTRALSRHIAEVRSALERAHAAATEPYAVYGRVHSWLRALEGDHRGAIEIATPRPARYDPAGAAWLDALALLAVRRHDEIAADQAITVARALEPTLERAIDHADLRMARGRASEAVAILRQAAQMAPRDARVARRHAEALMAAGRPHEAAAAAEAALAACGGPCHDLVVRAHLQAGQLEAAGEAAHRANTYFGETSPEGPYLRALVALAQARLDEASQLLDLALRRDPSHAGARQARRALRRR